MLLYFWRDKGIFLFCFYIIIILVKSGYNFKITINAYIKYLPIFYINFLSNCSIGNR
jgi:hypothetical protein